MHLPGIIQERVLLLYCVNESKSAQLAVQSPVVMCGIACEVALKAHCKACQLQDWVAYYAGCESD